jgi:recombination protein RecR
MQSPLLKQLIDAFQCLPGVGPKSAQRMAFYLLERRRPQALQLAETITQAMTHIGHCQQCNNLSEKNLCHLCTNPKRDLHLLCVVESPIDVLAIEQTGYFYGRYFVLMGRLSPLDGIGPEELNLTGFQKLLAQGQITEVILATNPTVEGEATAHYLAEIIREFHIKTSRIAHGVPIGGELEFIDGGTIARALANRDEV